MIKLNASVDFVDILVEVGEESDLKWRVESDKAQLKNWCVLSQSSELRLCKSGCINELSRDHGLAL